MKVIAQKIWNEPAVALGLLVSIVLAILALVDGADWDAQTIIGVIAPFASSLGIRQLVRPDRTPDEPEPRVKVVK
jgi:hypothetical protein